MLKSKNIDIFNLDKTNYLTFYIKTNKDSISNITCDNLSYYNIYELTKSNIDIKNIFKKYFSYKPFNEYNKGRVIMKLYLKYNEFKPLKSIKNYKSQSITLYIDKYNDSNSKIILNSIKSIISKSINNNELIKKLYNKDMYYKKFTYQNIKNTIYIYNTDILLSTFIFIISTNNTKYSYYILNKDNEFMMYQYIIKNKSKNIMIYTLTGHCIYNTISKPDIKYIKTIIMTYLLTFKNLYITDINKLYILYKIQKYTKSYDKLFNIINDKNNNTIINPLLLDKYIDKKYLINKSISYKQYIEKYIYNQLTKLNNDIDIETDKVYQFIDNEININY